MAVAGGARADVITQSVSARLADGYFGEAVGHYADFDRQLGTLTGVSISLTYSSIDRFELQSATAGTVTGTFDPFAILLIAGKLFFLPTPQPIAQTLTFFPTPPSPTASTTVEFEGTATINGNPADFYAAPGIAIPEEVDFSAGADIASGQTFEEVGTDTGHSFNSGANITITYTYDPVPDPTSLALFSVGILGVFAASWRGRFWARQDAAARPPPQASPGTPPSHPSTRPA